MKVRALLSNAIIPATPAVNTLPDVDPDSVTRGPLPRRIEFRPVDWVVLTVDLLVLVGIPLALISLHTLAPEWVHTLLTYRSDESTLHGLFGHWAVHYSDQHLLENLTGYGLVVLMGSVLAWALQEHRWFWLSVVTILLVVPPFSMLVSSVGFGTINPGMEYTSRGASAIVAALLGLLYVVAIESVRRVVDLRAAIAVGGTMLILSLSGLLHQVGSASLSVSIAILGPTVGILVLDVLARFRDGSLAAVRWGSIGLLAIIGFGVTVLMVVIIGGLFPADPFAGETLTNVFSHASGFIIGTVIAIWGRRYWTGDSWV